MEHTNRTRGSKHPRTSSEVRCCLLSRATLTTTHSSPMKPAIARTVPTHSNACSRAQHQFWIATRGLRAHCTARCGCPFLGMVKPVVATPACVTCVVVHLIDCSNRNRGCLKSCKACPGFRKGFPDGLWKGLAEIRSEAILRCVVVSAFCIDHGSN